MIPPLHFAILLASASLSLFAEKSSGKLLPRQELCNKYAVNEEVIIVTTQLVLGGNGRSITVYNFISTYLPIYSKHFSKFFHEIPLMSPKYLRKKKTC